MWAFAMSVSMDEIVGKQQFSVSMEGKEVVALPDDLMEKWVS